MDIKCTVTKEDSDTWRVELEHTSGMYTYHVQVLDEDVRALIPDECCNDTSRVMRTK